MSTPLKRLRKARGYTASAVAKSVGLDQGQYSRIENGAATTPATAEAIVEFFGRDSIDEVRILYPDRFPSPEAPTKVNGSASAKVTTA